MIEHAYRRRLNFFCVKKREGLGLVMTSNKVSGKGAYTLMRHDYNTVQFQAFRGEVRESFWGQVRWRTQHALQQLLEADSEPSQSRFSPLRKRSPRASSAVANSAALDGSETGVPVMSTERLPRDAREFDKSQFEAGGKSKFMLPLQVPPIPPQPINSPCVTR